MMDIWTRRGGGLGETRGGHGEGEEEEEEEKKKRERRWD